MAANAELQQWVARRWLFLAALEPQGQTLWELGPAGVRRYEPGAGPPEVMPPSSNWFRGKRGHLPFAELQAGARP